MKITIKTDLPVYELEKKLPNRNFLEASRNGFVEFKKEKNWIIETKMGRGMIYGPRYRWELFLEDDSITLKRKIGFLELEYLILISLCTIPTPIFLYGVVVGAPMSIVLVFLVYILIVVAMWSVWYWVYVKKSRKIIQNIIESYVLKNEG